MPSEEIRQAVAALAEAGRARQPGESALLTLDCAVMRITLRYEGLRAWSGQEPREGLEQAPETEPAPALIAPLRPEGVPACGLWLSEVESEILLATRLEGWQTAEQLAQRVGHELTNHFRSLLKNLSDRRILISSPRGYRRASG